MKYQSGDTVLYGQEVCEITGITTKTINGNAIDYYVLKPIYDSKTVVYAPVDNEHTSSKMKRILSEQEIHAVIKTVPDEDAVWISDDYQRRNSYKEIMANGDRSGLIKIIKTLYLYQQSQKEQGKKLHISDERLMKEAEKMLYEEFSHVLNLQPSQLLPLVLGSDAQETEI